jgi:hypothetical protein
MTKSFQGARKQADVAKILRRVEKDSCHLVEST